MTLDEATREIEELKAKIQALTSQIPAPRSPAETRLGQIHDYGWNWFSYHAGQRISMFNYFLAASAVLVAGLGSRALNQHNRALAMPIALIGAVTSFCFVMIDKRNKAFVTQAKNVLISTETVMFGNPQLPENVFGRGIVLADKRDDEIGIKDALVEGRHRFFLRAIEVIVMTAFVAAVALCWAAPDWLMPPKTPDAGAVEIQKSLASINVELTGVKNVLSSMAGRLTTTTARESTNQPPKPAARKSPAKAPPTKNPQSGTPARGGGR